jgi:ABC-type transport system involved in multi-copper enzyme maturation permease subunit
MIGQTLAIARNTFVESVRQPIFFVLIMLGGLLQIFNTLLSAYSLGYTDTSEVSGDDKMLLDIGLATVFVVATLLAGFVATAVLTREIDNKTALTVISKPVGRPLFIFGKYLGVTGAVGVATLILLSFFLLAIRHEVLATARDKIDWPVISFTALALLTSIGVATWGNFFYGWVFSSVATMLTLPTIILAWVGTLFVGEGWALQAPTEALKPQILLASLCLLLAMPVLCAVAIAASTRLGQVMTIFVAFGVFVLGLLSNHLLGKRAFDNAWIGVLQSVEVERDPDGNFSDAGDAWRITFEQAPTEQIGAGDPFHFGPAPNGVIVIPEVEQQWAGGEVSRGAAVDAEEQMLLYEAVEDPANHVYLIRNMGGLVLPRPPREGDYVFLEPTGISPTFAAAWGVVPNVQFFWLVDAVTQAHPIPARYVGLVALYSFAQIGAMLSLAVILFQRREVG